MLAEGLRPIAAPCAETRIRMGMLSTGAFAHDTVIAKSRCVATRLLQINGRFGRLNPSRKTMIEPLLLPSALIHVAASHPSHGVGIFDRSGRKCDRRTFPELLAMVQEFAGRWQRLGVAPGDRVILSLDTSWTWIGAWLGAVWLRAACRRGTIRPSEFG